ncbi:hypothetical protein FO519_003202 [Halicephalobus sp. NKZ332]|nr:hypothetical protein FO519_003202 [Halicephalobus sp. NKZ332]
MALHFHIHIDPIVYIAIIGCLIIKYDKLHPTYQVILVAMYLISILIELVRPYLGYYGNLGEKIPALSGFWITTLILQIPICCFLILNPEIYPLPFERCLLTIHLVFLLVEAWTSFFLVRSLADYQVQKFKATISEEKSEDTKNEAELVIQKILPEAAELDISVLPKSFTESVIKKLKKENLISSKDIMNPGVLYRAITLYTNYKRNEDDSRFTECLETMSRRIENLEKLQAEEECRIKKEMITEELLALRDILHRFRMRIEEDLSETKQGRRKFLPPPTIPPYRCEPLPEQAQLELKNPKDAPKRINIQKPVKNEEIVEEIEYRKNLAQKREKAAKAALTVPRNLEEFDDFVCKYEKGELPETDLRRVSELLKASVEVEALQTLLQSLVLDPDIQNPRSPSIEVISPEPPTTPSPFSEKLTSWESSPPALLGRNYSPSKVFEELFNNFNKN